VAKIYGIEEVRVIPSVIDIVCTIREGDEILLSDVGTLRQAIIRAFAVTKTKAELADVIDKIHNTVKVFSEEGENMLLDMFDTSELSDYEEGEAAL
jgi:hypothetical protein